MKKFIIWAILVFSIASNKTVLGLPVDSPNEVQVFNGGNKLYYLSYDDINLMAKIVYAESRGEPYEGKVAVASVILNRMKSGKYPSTITGVITEKNAFSCVVNGKILVTPTITCYNAVLDAVKGNDPTNSALFFYNPKISTCNWMNKIEKQNLKKIGNHNFFTIIN